MRRLLLWFAGHAWLASHVPRWGFARRGVKRFMPGEEFSSGLPAAAVAHYEEVIAASAGIRSEISVKPTQLGLDIDPAAAYSNLERLADTAARSASFVWLDMEGSAYTDATLDLYVRLRAGHRNTGICLQAYLHRTAADVARLLPLEPAIRLVKGAYAEPREIAFGSRHDVDANYLALCAFVMTEVKRKRLRLVLGTHDVRLIEQVWRFGEALDMQRSQIEINMLYGIRTDEQVKLARAGFAMKVLIAYGDAWYAWYLRRLAERPANVLFALRQILP
ncbi:MAG: proline dehydrogenase [Chloroflexi bacterium]|nr:MAG: proline dehydrogenase [Chloroflexota bacterium]